MAGGAPINAIPFLHLLRSVTGHVFHHKPVTIQQMTGKMRPHCVASTYKCHTDDGASTFLCSFLMAAASAPRRPCGQEKNYSLAISISLVLAIFYIFTCGPGLRNTERFALARESFHFHGHISA